MTRVFTIRFPFPYINIILPRLLHYLCKSVSN